MSSSGIRVTPNIYTLPSELDRFCEVIEGIGDRKITDDALRASLAVFNRNRELLRELYAIKRDTPWKVPVCSTLP